MHPAMAALDAQRQMVEWFDTASASVMVRTLYGQIVAGPLPTMTEHDMYSDFTDPRVMNTRVDGLKARLAQQFRLADTYWVQNNMVDLVDAAHESMPSHPMRQETLPTQFGWMYLGRSTTVTLSDDNPLEGVVLRPLEDGDNMPGRPSITFSAVSWRRAHLVAEDDSYRHGYEIWFYLDRDTVDRALHAGLDNPRFTPMADADGLPPFMAVRGFFWPDGQISPDGADSLLELTLAQWFQAAVILMDMPVAARSHAPGNRHVDRRLERAKMPIKPVTIVMLRSPRSKREGHEPGDEGREYSHRWMVDGHWRNQYYPSTGEHRVIYIHPYVKGPEDMPLVIKQKVNAWVR